MLSDPTRAALERALAMPTDNGMADFRRDMALESACDDALGIEWEDKAKWLLAADAAHRAAVREAVEKERSALLAVLLRHKSDIQAEVLRLYFDKSEASKQHRGELLRRERVLVNILRDWDELRDNDPDTIAALRQEGRSE